MDEERVKAEYRNSKRSRTMIRTALLSLMVEKEFSHITVTDIVKRADINRGTFYAHFSSPSEVLVTMQKDFFSGIEMLFDETNPIDLLLKPSYFLTQISDYLIDNIDLSSRLLSVADSYSVFYSYAQGICSLLDTEEVASIVKDPKKFSLTVQFAVSGFITLYISAIKEADLARLSQLPSLISNIIEHLVKPNLR